MILYPDAHFNNVKEITINFLQMNKIKFIKFNKMLKYQFIYIANF